MSIIGGIIGSSYQAQYNTLLNAMSCYKTEPIEVIHQDQFYAACGIQHFTAESLNEQLPLREDCLTITADAILDNRTELVQELDIQMAPTDSRLILEAYKKWGTHCTDYLLGDYAFAIWNHSKQLLFCARDHVGKRSLYYTQTAKQFIFCTVMAPILAVTNNHSLNERWLAEFLSIQGVVHEINISETVYKDIRQLPPGHQMILTKDNLVITQYWHPEKIKTLKLESDMAYEQAFRKVFDKAVKCRLRSLGNVGIMLSSGLDSTAVAAVAAPELGRQGKKLLSFTEIPAADYTNQMGVSKIINEAPYVLEMQKLYPNIEPSFDSFESKNAFQGIDERIKVLEQPYKIIENLYWLEGILEKAQKKHCTILLDGQFGNFSISQGNVLCYWNTLLHHCHWIRLLKEINIFCRVNHGSRKKAYPNIFKKLFKQFGSGHLNIDPLVSVNPQLAQKYQCLQNIKQQGYLFDDKRILQERTQKQFVTNLILFSHMGSIETKQSLVYGLLRRDPTRDKRVIEFCLGVPQEQYVHKGIERSLIRRAMKDDIPDSIRLNYYARGKQAADWQQRLKPFKTAIEEELQSMLEQPCMKTYIDCPKLAGFLRNYKQQQETDVYGFELKSLMIALVFYHFITSQTCCNSILDTPSMF